MNEEFAAGGRPDKKEVVLTAGPDLHHLDLSNANFPIDIIFGHKEYVIVKTKFGGLMMNGKNRSSKN
jgi:hypothetical protein